nr:immunoglobulin heavy chain junction region [Macaca mulatta]
CAKGGHTSWSWFDCW